MRKYFNDKSVFTSLYAFLFAGALLLIAKMLEGTVVPSEVAILYIKPLSFIFMVLCITTLFIFSVDMALEQIETNRKYRNYRKYRDMEHRDREYRTMRYRDMNK